MKKFYIIAGLILVILIILIAGRRHQIISEIVRPERIVSMRIKVYEKSAYSELAELWRQYDQAYPSEEAYANWMYAARYAGNPDYETLLAKGLEKYPANPTLLYLKGILCHGQFTAENIKYLEKSAGLDPSYMDPWYGLVTNYMEKGEEEKADLALRRLLEAGAVPDEVMDYNYNVLATLDKNAVLITNGDMDTYPIWMLQRIENFRTDVTMVNRSLLNTDWYPAYMMQQGLPQFIEAGDIPKLHDDVVEQHYKNKPYPKNCPIGEILITKIIASSEKNNRPVYFAATMYKSEILKEYFEGGWYLGLATLVSKPHELEKSIYKKSASRWLQDFRTSGLHSWRLKHADEAETGKSIGKNYVYGTLALAENLSKSAPAVSAELFAWYLENLDFLLSDKDKQAFAVNWKSIKGVPEIEKWCREQGL